MTNWRKILPTNLSQTSRRLTLSMLVLLTGFGIAVSIFVNALTEDFYQTRREELQHIISLTHNSLEPILIKRQQGEISIGEARVEATKILSRFTYNADNENNYIFLTTYEGYLLVDPNNPNAVGTYQMQLKDCQGNYITQELIKAAKSGGGFVVYYQARSPTDVPQKKLSYVVGIPELECFIGSGIYVIDIDRSINNLFTKLLILGTIILILILSLQYYFLQPLLYGITTLSTAFKQFGRNPENVPDLAILPLAKGTEAEILLTKFIAMANQIKSHRIALKTNEERFRLAAQAANDVIWDWDGSTGICVWSDRIEEITGYKALPQKANFEVPEEWIHADDLERRRLALSDHLTGKTDFYCCEYRIYRDTGEYRWVLAKGKAVLNNAGLPARMVGALTDTTDQKRRDEEILRLAYYDSLTQMPNRAYLNEHMLAELTKAAGGQAYGAIMFIDLNNFKRVNDLLGHSEGDKVLIQVAKRIEAALSARGILVRLGGDEFVIVAPNHNSAAAGQLAEQLICASSYPVNYQDEAFYVSASIGIAIYPDDGCDLGILLSKADIAMYHTKEATTNGYTRFLPYMQEAATKKIQLESLLHKALDRNEFYLQFQPQILLSTNKVICFEALLRWNRPDKGPVPPADFIPIAEENGLIIPIGYWVLTKSCQFCRDLLKRGFSDVQVAVNVSARQIEQPDFVSTVATILDEAGIPASCLEIEITESLLMLSGESSLKKLETLQAMGVKIALDDFGTGYSSLTYLRKLPINALKIDKEFIDDLETKNKPIVDTIIRLAHSLGLIVVAEGVERRDQADFLAECSCDRVQGFLFSRPVSEEEALEYIKAINNGG